jgi:hypothetical protein
MGRCRVTKVFRSKQNPQQAVMSVSFRQVGQKHDLAIIIRMPPLAKQGEAVVLAVGNKQGVKIPVAGCTEKQLCTAIGGIGASAQSQMFASQQAVLVFPPRDNGQRPQIGLPMTGLSEAITAMRRADPVPAH